VCSARLPAVVCARCYFENLLDNAYCGQCGQPLASDKAPGRQNGSVTANESRATSIVAISGVQDCRGLGLCSLPLVLDERSRNRPPSDPPQTGDSLPVTQAPKVYFVASRFSPSLDIRVNQRRELLDNHLQQ
jgi:hypothetical protein